MSPIAPPSPEEAPTEESTWSSEERREEWDGLSDSDKESLRQLAKDSLYVLCKGVLGYPDVTPRAHKELCEKVCETDYDKQTDSTKKRRMYLLPRAHLKSTIVTIGDSIRVVIRNPEYERVLLPSETAGQSQKFLSEIKQHWEKNEVLRGLFSELVPEKFTGPSTDWSATRATLRREAGHREAHWTTVGVGGAITGGHFSRIRCDDLIGLEAYRSPAAMQEAIDWNSAIEPFLINQNRDIIEWVGTRWSPNDLYQSIMDFYGDELEVYTRTAIENGEIIFPELHSWEEYNRLQQNNPDLWYAQYENNPISGGPTDLPIESIRNFNLTPDGEEVSFRLDDGTNKKWKVRDLDRVITADPNSGSPVAPDMAAVVVVGVSPDDEAFVLESKSDRWDPHTYVQEIYGCCMRWRPRIVGIEKAGQQNTQFYFEKLMREQGRFFQVEELKPMKREKMERIRYNLQPTIVSGKLFLLASQTELRQQIKQFPNNIIVDELDALGYAPELWRIPRDSKDKQDRQRKALRLLMTNRNPRTGY